MHDAPLDGFRRLLALVQRLRSPDGCPWDLAQTPRTLREGLVEEAWEAVSAIDAADEANLAEELGDLYLLVTLIAWIKEQEGAFSVAAVLEGICGKLVRRHPHVFGDSPARSVNEILAQWQSIKQAEKGPAAPASALDGVPGSLPPLEKAASVQRKAAKVGFDWPGQAPVWDKLDEELAELREAAGRENHRLVEEELGDVLFTVVNLSRFLGVDPALALAATVRKFERRFRGLEERLRQRGLTPVEAGLAGMDEIWNQLKVEERSPGSPPGGHSTSK
jgi:tetrapyrrole methylase family protein / MazG family protein